MQSDSIHTAGRRGARSPLFLVGALAASLAACGDERERAALDVDRNEVPTDSSDVRSGTDVGARSAAGVDSTRTGANLRGGYDVDEYQGGATRTDLRGERWPESLDDESDRPMREQSRADGGERDLSDKDLSDGNDARDARGTGTGTGTAAAGYVDIDVARARIDAMFPLLVAEDATVRGAAEDQLYRMGWSGRLALSRFVMDADRARGAAAARLLASDRWPAASMTAPPGFTASTTVRSGERAGPDSAGTTRRSEGTDRATTAAAGDDAEEADPGATTRSDGGSPRGADTGTSDGVSGSPGTTSRAPGGAGTPPGENARPDQTQPESHDDFSRAPGGLGTPPGGDTRPDQTLPTTTASGGSIDGTAGGGTTDGGSAADGGTITGGGAGAIPGRVRSRDFVVGYAAGRDDATAAFASFRSDDALGILWMPLPGSIRRHLGVEAGGMIVYGIQRGSVAGRLGVQLHDIVLEVNDRPVATSGDVLVAASRGTNGRLSIEVLRDGRRRTLRGDAVIDVAVVEPDEER